MNLSNALKGILVCFLSIICMQSVQSQETLLLETTTVTSRDVAVGLQIPWEILWGPDDHIWVTERRGRVLRVEPESGNTETILNYEAEVSGNGDGEPGMLGMALHPDFENSPLVYIAYTFFSGGIKERLSQFTYNGTELVDEVVLLDDIQGANIHNGSRLLISPDDKIFMTIGDRGNSDLSQSLSSLNGKLLRLNLDGSIPDDNPDPESYIYSYGHRNAQGLCWGPDGTLYSSEHGQNHSDEVNIIKQNQNYGWPFVEGPCNTSNEQQFCADMNLVDPIYAWTDYCIAPNGLVFYDHPAIPEWNSSLLVAILGGISAQEPRISQLRIENDNGNISVLDETEYFSQYGRIRDICINPHDGAIFFATNGPGYPGSGPNRIIEYRNLDYEAMDTTGTNIGASIIQSLDVYPNPAVDQLFIDLSETFIGHSFEVIGFNGQRMTSKQIDESNFALDVSDYPVGSYYAKAVSPQGIITKTFVIKK